MDAAPKIPFFTADLPGIGGQIKTVAEDFEVEEIPAYEPRGEGDFLYLWMEKRGMGAEYFVRQVAQRLGLTSREVGTAGLKDRHAVTRQWVSVPALVEPQLAALESADMQVLRVSRHVNKLRAGHLHGNRFRVLIRNPSAGSDTLSLASAIADRIRHHGLPNFYGAQRFGRDGETLQLGLDLIRQTSGDSESRRRARSPFLRKLALSAVQSALFNDYLARRLAAGEMHRVLEGDVMAKWPFGGMFVAENLAVEQARFDRREIVPAGPIFGRKTFPCRGLAAEKEQAVLTGAGLDRSSFSQFGKLLMGTRRHNLVLVGDLTLEMQLDGLQLTFTLPAGTYATILIRELTKTDPADDERAENI